MAWDKIVILKKLPIYLGREKTLITHCIRFVVKIDGTIAFFENCATAISVAAAYVLETQN